jgi:hypothetical protein
VSSAGRLSTSSAGLDDVRAALAQAIAQAGPALRRGNLPPAESAVLLDALVQASMFDEAEPRRARSRARQAETMADALGKALVDQGAVRPAALRKLQPFLHAAALALSRERAGGETRSTSPAATDTAVVSDRARAISAAPPPNTETLRFLAALAWSLESPTLTFVEGRPLELTGVLRASDGRRLFFAVTIGQEDALLDLDVHFDASYRPIVIPLRVDFPGDARRLEAGRLFIPVPGGMPGVPVDLAGVLQVALAAASAADHHRAEGTRRRRPSRSASQMGADSSSFEVTVEVPDLLALPSPGPRPALDRPA